MFDIKEELKKLPDKPGVYLMKDSGDRIIYVGKAKLLKNRVRQYFQSQRNQHPKVVQMVGNINSFEIIITDSELEALILECNLIKRYKPKYNILLRDDKHYPYIKVTMNEQFPKIMSVRRVSRDKAKYYGPFSSSAAVNETVELCGKLFKLRSCTRSLPRDIGKKRPCLNYHIGKCSAPCAGHVSAEEYAEKINGVLLFLGGKHTEIINILKSEMTDASENLEFEKAAQIRDKISSIEAVLEKQKIDAGDDDRDILAFARVGAEAVVQLFFVRSGKMIGAENFLLVNSEGMSDSEMMSEILKQFYSGGAFIPKEIVTATEASEAEIISEWLSKFAGRKITLLVPKKGEKARLVKLAEGNAQEALTKRLEEMKREYSRAKGALNELQAALSLENEPLRIEAYDISNIHGFESVGSMVVFENGKPKRSDYRKFRIKSVAGANDAASIREVIYRRFSHGLTEIQELKEKGADTDEGKFSKLPDVIMLDGGKAQANAAKDALSELALDIPVCGMVKDDKHRTRGLIYENAEIALDRMSEGFKLVTRIQDEVHRFSIDYHRRLMGKSQVKSVLDDIKGVGPARRKILHKHFTDVEALKNASIEELCAVPGIDSKTAENIYGYFRG